MEVGAWLRWRRAQSQRSDGRRFSGSALRISTCRDSEALNMDVVTARGPVCPTWSPRLAFQSCPPP